MRRSFALFLAMSMILSAAPFGAFATMEETAPATEAIVEVEPIEETAPAAVEEVTAETEAPVVLADGDISSGTPDGEPPVLTGMTLSVTTVTAPGEIEVTVSATDDVSGVRSASVSFYCKETKRDLYASLSPTYWDSNAGKQIAYADGNLHGKIKIDQYLETGTFVLDSIGVTDNAGNYRGYYPSYNPEWHDPEDGPIPDFVTQREICVVDSEVPDGTPPLLTDMTLQTAQITAPGEIEVIISATDDVSGVRSASVSFYCKETKRDLYASLSPTYWDSNAGKQIAYADGNLHGKIKIDQYLETGTFVLDSIGVTDNAGNYRGYYPSYNPEWHDPEDGPIPDFVTQREIHVTDSGTPDGTPPILTAMVLAATTMNAPGEIEVIISATDDVSGVRSASVSFYCKETKRDLYASLSPTYWDSNAGKQIAYADGNLHGKIKIDQYLETGTFVLDSIGVTDNAGNYRGYYPSYNPEWHDPEDGPIPDFVTQRAINILNAIPDVTTSVAKPEFVDQVQDAADDAYIVADFSGETTMPEEVFDAIAGTDKTLDLVSEGVTWRFNGEDITNDSKPIDLNVQITKVEENTSDAGQEIQNKLDETPGVVMKFAENGELPGKATIQVKVDYAMRQYLGTDQKLCVYYYNNQTGQLELVAEDLTVLNDTYVEFTITHCSYYVLTTKLDSQGGDAPEVNDVHWKLENGTLTIYGKGKMDDYGTIDVPVDVGGWVENKIYGNTPWYTHADEITAIVIEEGITHVGEFSFFGLDKVASVKLPSTLRTIGGHSFQNNTGLTSIDLPKGLRSVGPYAFGGCMGINELKLPSTLLALGGWSFDCGIEKLHIDSMEYWMNVEFGPGESWGQSTANPMCSQKCELYVNGVLTTDIMIPEGTTAIPMYSFYQLKSLTSITIPDSVTSIGEGAFWGCEGLTEIVIPDSVTYLGTQVLFECSNLKSATLPAGLTEIPYGTFASCKNLMEFKMPKNVTSIGHSAFDGCKNLTYFSADNSLENVTYLGDYAFLGCENLEFGDLKLSDELYYLGSYALARCNKLTGVTIPDSCHDIGWMAFCGSESLAKVTIEEGVGQIGSCAFYGCTALTSIIIPRSVWKIDNSAFCGSGLQEIYILNESCEIVAPVWEGDAALGVPGVTTVYGLIGSTAEAHAAQYGYAFDLIPQTCEFGFHNHVLTDTILPTCLELGAEIHTCTCGDILKKDIPNIGHNVVDGICTNCSEAFVAFGEDNGGYWTLNPDGVLTIYNINRGSGILSFWGTPWEAYTDQITKVVLGTGIAGYTLHWMYTMDPPYYPNLTTLELGADVGWIQPFECFDAPKLSKFIVHGDNEDMFVRDGVLYSWWISGEYQKPELRGYPAGRTETTYYVDADVHEISRNAFFQAKNLQTVYIQSAYAQTGAFDGCSDLTDVYLMEDNISLWDNNGDGVPDNVERRFGDPAKVTIHSFEDSYAQTYAKDYGYKFVPLTDCDISDHDWVRGAEQDGKVTDACSRCDATQTHTLLPDGMNVAVPDTAETTLKKELTAEEAARVEAGESYQFYLDTFDISKEVSANEQELLEKALKELEGYKVGSFMDISLYKQVGDDKPAALTELDEPIPVVVNVPKQLQNTSKYIERTYDVVRIHEGKSTVLGGTYDAENQTFTFETDAFSTYILVYHDLRLGGMLGDVNDDDAVNVLDLMYLANYFAKGEIINQANADVNGDGLLDVRDLMFLANVFAGKETLG